MATIICESALFAAGVIIVYALLLTVVDIAAQLGVWS